MSSSKRKMFRNLLSSANLGCGCGKPKPTDIIEPKPMPKAPLDHHHQKPSLCPSSSSSTWEKDGGHSLDDEDYTSTTSFSFNIDTSPHCSEHGNVPDRSKMVTPSSKLDNSIAVVKDSGDPYHDFRQSMLQMIFEKEIYTKDDLQELLNCFLQLNSPAHHDTIVKAFMEIWNGVISKSPLSKKLIASQESHET